MPIQPTGTKMTTDYSLGLLCGHCSLQRRRRRKIPMCAWRSKTPRTRRSDFGTL